MAFTYNTHLLELDDENKTTIPMIQGYFYLLGDNTTDENNKTVMPEWTEENVLRVCMQFYSDEYGSNWREQIRWVLNYTYPMNFANFTP